MWANDINKQNGLSEPFGPGVLVIQEGSSLRSALANELNIDTERR
jgi:hypothetical protein